MNKSIGIIANSNEIGGINKLIAMMANDITEKNFDVCIYVPILPWYTYYVLVFKKFFFWILRIVPHYFFRWIFKRKSSLLDLLNTSKLKSKKIQIIYYLYKIDKSYLKKHDRLILNGIGSLIECKNLFPQEKQIYLVNQIEEIYHGKQYTDYYRNIRKNFKGNVITHCNFMKKFLKEDVSNFKIVPNPISPLTWKLKNNFDNKNDRKDILFYWKSYATAESGFKLLDELFKLDNSISISIFGRKTIDNRIKKIASRYNAKLYYDLNEQDVANLYLNHSFLFFPNKFEDFGMPPVECLACGCIPILRYGVGASDMYAVDNFNSIFITNSEYTDAKKILSFLNNNSKILDLRKNVLQNIEQFNPKDYGQKILGNYNS